MTTEPDASGNGNDGTYNNPPVFAAGLVPGDTAWNQSGTTEIAIPDLTVSWLNAWSMDFWVDMTFAEATSGPDFFLAQGGDPSHAGIVQVRRANADVTKLKVTAQGILGDFESVAGALPNDEAAHHIAITYNGVPSAPVVLMYVDGASVSLSVSFANVFNPVAPFNANLASGFTGGGIFDEFATYPTVLTSGQIAAHYAARTSFAAYSAAVLADGPVVYYHFSSVASGIFVGQIGISA